MAEGGTINRPSLKRKENSRSKIWDYFGLQPDEDGKVDNNKPICRTCFKTFQVKSGNTTNLAKHLSDKHPGLSLEFRRQQQKSVDKERENVGPLRQPTLPAVFEQQKKYHKDSKEAKKLNRAVAEFICMDQVQIYTVEKEGFRQLMEQMNNKYQLPGRNYFMYTEIPTMYSETRSVVSAELAGKPFFSCTTDLWTSRATDTFMAVTLQFITESWDMQAWCLGCPGLSTDHTAENLREALEELIEDAWSLDMSKMAGITTDNASNNRKVFEGLTWIPCFGHNLHLAINKAIGIDRVSAALSRLCKTLAAFTRSPKMSRLLVEKQADLNLPVHKLVHDEPTRWNSTYDMVERFIEKQQAVCAVLAQDRKKWHLMPKDSNITIIETVKDVLAPLSDFTDGLSGEKHTTLSSVLPLTWKISSCVTALESDSILTGEMKDKIRRDLEQRYEDRHLQKILNTATYLDPRFKNSFVTMETEVKQGLLEETDTDREVRCEQSTESTEAGQQEHKRRKKNLQSLLSSIQSEKKGETQAATEAASSTAQPTDRLNSEFLLYSKMPEVPAEDDPLAWWRATEKILPQLAQLAKKYLCISASSCASERVFSTSGFICSPRRTRLTQANIDMLVFLSKNLSLAKQLR